MNSLFNHAVKQSQLLKKDLGEFAKSPETSPLSLQGQISATMTNLSRTLDDYEAAVSNEIIEERKERAKERVEKFRRELADAREEFKSLKKRREEEIHQSNRQELLGRRHVSTAAGVSGGSVASGSVNGGAGGVPNNEPDNPYHANSNGTINRSEGLSRENDVLARTGQQLDEFIERGLLALGDLGEQKDMLKKTRRSIYNAASTLGISDETIRMVDKRAFQDKWIFYGGVIFMLVCFYYILKWFG